MSMQKDEITIPPRISISNSIYEHQELLENITEYNRDIETIGRSHELRQRLAQEKDDHNDNDIILLLIAQHSKLTNEINEFEAQLIETQRINEFNNKKIRLSNNLSRSIPLPINEAYMFKNDNSLLGHISDDSLIDSINRHLYNIIDEYSQVTLK